jgi:hypothetical protein
LTQISVAWGWMLTIYLPEVLILPWLGSVASLWSLGIYALPWQRWGWQPEAFQRFVYVTPMAVVLLTERTINISSLLITGGVYSWLAMLSRQARLSYLGLLAANWAGLQLFIDFKLTAQIWSISLVGLSLLLVAQIDPALRQRPQKQIRHWLRCFAVGLMMASVLYESDPHFLAGLLAIGLCLGLVGLGLGLKVRAFLYVGTLAFLAKILRVVWLFVADESLVLWALGIALGLVLIWIAATFEARRTQMTALLQYWVQELSQWQ